MGSLRGSAARSAECRVSSQIPGRALVSDYPINKNGIVKEALIGKACVFKYFIELSASSQSLLIPSKGFVMRRKTLNVKYQ